MKSKRLHDKAKDVKILGIGYDVRSFDENGNVKKIEVKTTNGPNTTEFILSENEVKVMRESKQNNEKYCIYRLYNYDKQNNNADFYIIDGDVEKQLEMENYSYKVTLKDRIHLN